MKWWRAISAGFAGGLVAVAVLVVGSRLLGVDADTCALIGAMLTGAGGAAGWLAGFGAQLVVAIFIALVYATIFEWVTRRAGPVIGLVIAVPHVLVAGLAVGFVAAARLAAAGVDPPGAFLEYRGDWAVAAFVLAHILYGTVVGLLYGRTRHRPPTRIAVWRDVTVASGPS